MRAVYRFNRAYKIACQMFGEPTHKPDSSGGYYTWQLGEARLEIYQFFCTPTDCFVNCTVKRDGKWFTGEAGIHERSVSKTFFLFSQSVNVLIGDGVSLQLDASGNPVVLGHRVPDALVPLAREVLRGQLEPTLFLDAIKHDTEILA